MQTQSLQGWSLRGSPQGSRQQTLLLGGAGCLPGPSSLGAQAKGAHSLQTGDSTYLHPHPCTCPCSSEALKGPTDSFQPLHSPRSQLHGKSLRTRLSVPLGLCQLAAPTVTSSQGPAPGLAAVRPQCLNGRSQKLLCSLPCTLRHRPLSFKGKYILQCPFPPIFPARALRLESRQTSPSARLRGGFPQQGRRSEAGLAPPASEAPGLVAKSPDASMEISWAGGRMSALLLF